MTVRSMHAWHWALPCVVLLIFGAALRWPTLEPQANYLSFAASRLAYSDVVAFYSADHPIPYLERNFEYPVVTGLTFWLTGFMPGGIKGYFLANALILSAALLACFAYLARLGSSVRLTHFALAPGLAFYSVLNWDALGLVGLVAATYYMRRQRFGWAGASLAFGASAKLFPIFILPVLWAHTVHRTEFQPRRENPADILKWVLSPASRRFLTSFAIVMLALNLPLAILDLDGWSYFLRFQAGRTSNVDSIWQHLPPIPDQMQSLLFALVFLGGMFWLTLRVVRGDRWEIAALLTLLLFLLCTKIYSPQYDLWILPLLALVGCPVGLWLGFICADVAYYWAIFFFYSVVAGGVSSLDIGTAELLVGVAVWLRELALAVLFIWGLHRLRAPCSPETRPLLVRALEALTNTPRELRQLRSAVKELQSELAALRLAGTTHEAANRHEQDQLGQRAGDERNVE